MSQGADHPSEKSTDESHQLQRSDFAWEFLRRNRRYRRDYSALRRQQTDGKPDERMMAAKLAPWGLSFRLRPGPSGGPSPSPLAAGIRADRRAVDARTAGICGCS
jgi:hypothetical protein